MANPREEPAAPKASRVRFPILLSFAGLILSWAIVGGLHGSKWPTVFFVLAGVALPVPIASLLARLRHPYLARPGPPSLVLLMLAIAAIAYVGKHPSPGEVFQQAFGVAPPQSVTQLQALRGWLDGTITVLHFRADPAAIPALVPAGATKVEDRLGITIDPSDEAASQAYSERIWWHATHSEPSLTPR